MNSSGGGSDPPKNVGYLELTHDINSVDSDDIIMNPVNSSLSLEASVSDDLGDTNSNNLTNNTSISNTDSSKVNSVGDKNISNAEKTRPVIYYKDDKFGIFEVYMESKNQELNIGNFHALSLAKYVFDNNFQGAKRINRKGKNRISVEFYTFSDANQFVEKHLNHELYNVFIPFNKVSCKCIIRNVDLDFSIDVIKKYVQTGSDDRRVLEVRRLKRKHTEPDKTVTYIPTGTVCLTMSGTSLPREVSICGLYFKVLPYLFPVVQCFNCLRYGHIAKQCRAKKRCFGCGSLTHENHLCVLKCIHCESNEHNSTSKLCPEYTRQFRIKEIMSLENKSFFEASERVPQLPNKIKKSNNPYLTNLSEFPLLKNNSGVVRLSQFPQEDSSSHLQDTIQIHERREVYRQENPGPSYSSIAKSVKKRKVDLSQSKQFNWKEHNQCLISPNGRIASSQSSPGFNFFPQSSPSNSNVLQANTDAQQRDDLGNSTLEHIIKTASILTTAERAHVLNFMTQLESLVRLRQSPYDQSNPR